MNPSPPAVTAIQAFISGLAGEWTNPDSAIVAAANTPAVSNPTNQGTVPKPYTIASLMGSLSSGSLANLRSFPPLYQLMGDIVANNSANVLVAIQFLASSGDILSAEATTLEGLVTATQLDPSWSAEIGWAQATLGRPLDLADVEAARNAPGGQPV